MNNKLKPARIISPGKILKKELDSRSMTVEDLAQEIDWHTKIIQQIIDGKRAISPDIAGGLSEALGISIEFWLNLEANYQRDVEKSDRT